MAELAILFVPLLSFLAFFLWDRRRLNKPVVRPMARERMDKGVVPTATLGWPVSIVVGLLALSLAFAQWQAPTPRPYSGRWALLAEAIFQSFGPNGMAGVFLAVGLVSLGYGLIRWVQSR